MPLSGFTFDLALGWQKFGGRAADLAAHRPGALSNENSTSVCLAKQQRSQGVTSVVAPFFTSHLALGWLKKTLVTADYAAHQPSIFV